MAQPSQGKGLMTVPAVGTPATTPGNEGGSPPAPAGNEQPGSGAPPQGTGEPGNPPEPGKGGQEPAGSGSGQQPAPGEGDEPKPAASQEQQPPAPGPGEPRRLTQDEWQAQQAAIKRQLEDEEAVTAAAKLITDAPVKVRDEFDTLAEKLDITIPAELRKPIVDLINDLAQTGTKGAERKWQGQYNELKETLDDTSLAFLGACETAAERQKFADMVRGKDPAVWVKSILDLKTPAIAAKALENASTAQAALLPEGEVRDAFTAKVKGEHDPKKIAQAFHDSLVGVVGPSGEPRVAARGSAGGRPTLAEVTRRRAAGEYKTDAEFLKDQDLALQGT